MTYWLFFIGFVIYSGTAWISYSDSIKQSWFYYPLGIILSIIANYAWLTIAKIVPDKDKILIYGSFWDSILLFTFILIPFLFFDVKLGLKDSVGFGFIVTGMLIIKFLKF